MAVYNGGGQGLIYIGRSVNPEPLDQTDSNKRWRCNLGGGGGTDIRAEPDMWDQGVDRPTGGASWPHLSSPRGLPRGNAFWWPRERERERERENNGYLDARQKKRKQ
jgi:hypothetical protein